MGEFLYLGIYVVQQLGVMLGVGAQTVLLCTHLLSIHRGEAEAPHASYAEAARKSLSAGLFLIIVSGAAAVAVHLFGGGVEILLAPAFAFKWVLIGLVLCALWLNNRLSQWSNTMAWFSGGSWYALFWVHSLAPVTTWLSIGVLYVLWMLLFAIFWSVFMLAMRKTARVAAPTKAPVAVVPRPVIQKPAPPPIAATPPPTVVIKPVAPAAPAGPSFFKRLLLWLESLSVSKPHAAVPPPIPAAPPAPKPILPPPPPPAVVKAAPPPPRPVPAPPAPKLELAPERQPLSLPVPPAPSAPAPAPEPKPPALVVQPVVTPVGKPGLLQEVIDHLLVPALRVMPRSPEDIGSHNRPPVVKLSDE